MTSESLANQPSMRIKTCTFQFEIDSSKSKDLPIGECISSPIFTAGGYDWALNYYPQGSGLKNQGSHASLFLLLKSKAEDITTEFSFVLFNRRGNIASIYERLAKDNDNTFVGVDNSRGPEKFIARDKIQDQGILEISCNIIVLTEPTIIQNYPGGLHEHIQKLRKKGDKFDVTFEVEGESIYAHRLILATRSPVFEAKLFGPMEESMMERIKMDEMQAKVFKALIHFIYTDQRPIDEFNDAKKDDKTLSFELLQDLLMAANRYSIEKLILLCEEQLRRNLSVDMVATTLILADQHSRTSLKAKCLDFASVPENFLLIALTEGYHI